MWKCTIQTEIVIIHEWKHFVVWFLCTTPMVMQCLIVFRLMARWKWVSMPTSASNIYSYKHLHHILWGLMYFYLLVHCDLQSWLERTPLLHSTAITLSGLLYRQETPGMQEKQLRDLLRRTVKKTAKHKAWRENTFLRHADMMLHSTVQLGTFWNLHIFITHRDYRKWGQTIKHI